MRPFLRMISKLVKWRARPDGKSIALEKSAQLACILAARALSQSAPFSSPPCQDVGCVLPLHRILPRRAEPLSAPPISRSSPTQLQLHTANCHLSDPPRTLDITTQRIVGDIRYLAAIKELEDRSEETKLAAQCSHGKRAWVRD